DHRPDQRPVAGVEVDEHREPLARLGGIGVAGAAPLLADLDELATELADEGEDQRGDVVEVAVEDRPREAGRRHQRVDAELAIGPFAQEGLAGGKDLPARLLRLLAAPGALPRDAHGRTLSTSGRV